MTLRSLALASLLPVLIGCPRRSSVWVAPQSRAKYLLFQLGNRRGEATPLDLWTLEVKECRTGGRPVWRLAINSALLEPDYRRRMWDFDEGVPRYHADVAYGQVPRGYAQERPALPLYPGHCYMVETEAEGRGYTAFRVLPDGRIAELPENETQSLLGAWREGIVREDGSMRPFTKAEAESAARAWHAPHRADSIAHERCSVSYHVARSRADTALVDRQVPYDTLSNGLLTYTNYPGRGLTCKFVCTKIGPNAGPEEATRRSSCAAPIRNP